MPSDPKSEHGRKEEAGKFLRIQVFRVALTRVAAGASNGEPAAGLVARARSRSPAGIGCAGGSQSLALGQGVVGRLALADAPPARGEGGIEYHRIEEGSKSSVVPVAMAKQTARRLSNKMCV